MKSILGALRILASDALEHVTATRLRRGYHIEMPRERRYRRSGAFARFGCRFLLARTELEPSGTRENFLVVHIHAGDIQFAVKNLHH